MNKQTEALKMAIADLELCNGAQTVEDIIIYTHEAIQACKEALAQPEVSDAELVSYRQGYEQGRFDYEMDLELGKIEQPARLVSYAPDKSTCTLNIDGEEVYFNREQPTQEPMAWISVDDKLPEFVTVNNYEKSSDDILILIDGKHVYVGSWIYDNWSKTNDFCMRDLDGGYEGIGDMNVTHWMPLPDAPKE